MKYLFIGLALTVSSLSYSQDAKAQGILDKVSEKIKALKTFYVEFSATVKNTSNGTNTNLSGKGWVKGDKFSAVYGENTMISNGLKKWSIVKEEKTVYEADASGDDDDAINPKKLLTIWESGFKNKYDKEETLNGEKVHVIYLYPKNPKKANYHTVILYISKEDNELKKAIMKSNDGTVSTYSLTKFTSNPVIEDSKFVFDKSKYPGYTVVKD
ncbi:LolA family protein [Fluviicola taffensis]|uniref:Outer membrane lipoprotein carrier protein LolA n=1 Tax=Fluviicola taffensis (strain DSM 16823 / NCIMB 13979 / RW262) TaxID=755732 RepID=F2IFR2_FLUTR|nr:outer membrane lipoprotein carrier protein LolA [Fluviicola taffensis]AEA42520.1 outer membrane lipoprotein carrier protein LolA [Fluviicola taffensis DSM 16823]